MRRALGRAAAGPVALLLLGLAGCTTASFAAKTAAPAEIELFDTARQRPVRILLYGQGGPGRRPPLAIISHGYGGHAGAYSFLAAALTARGYAVASIEHEERPGDPPMVDEDDLARRRRSVWQVGADSIGFVIDELRRRGLAEIARGVVLVGHSNGGDMTMLFAAEHPERVRIALSLDNRRMPLPRTRRPRICSLRSSDLEADPGVLPMPSEQAAFGMTIVRVPVRHDDMWDGAEPSQRRAMVSAITACLDPSPP